MKSFIILAITILILSGCNPEISEEKRPLVDAINKKVDNIDANHRVRIVEDDFHQGDSIYKIRGYFMDDFLLKLVGVLHTPHLERDDYFYFENHKPIFSGHVLVRRDDQIASEYKYYYSDDGHIDESLFWKDHYERGKQFPHEHFKEFRPNQDSLILTEKERLMFFLAKLNLEGFEIRHLNENLSANVKN